MSETEYYIHLAQQLGYLKDNDLESLTAMQVEASKTLYGLIHWAEGRIAAGKVTKKDLERERSAEGR
jgi:hypothetical protein